MSLIFQCPSCKRNLQYEGGDSLFQICRHCRGKIIVPSQVVHQQEDEHNARRRQNPLQKLNPQLSQIQNELKSGNKINAIKIFRETYGTDLRSAKEAIDTMEYGGNLPAVSTRRQSSSVVQPGSSAVQKKNLNTGSTLGNGVWVVIRIVFFAALAYWFFNS